MTYFFKKLDHLLKTLYISANSQYRSVAQSGSVLHWGCRGRRFKSCRSDHFNKTTAYKNVDPFKIL